MQEFINILVRPLHFLLFSLILLVSCFGQDQKMQETNKENDTSSVPVIIDFLGDQTIHDPLFYIEGQLCQHVRKIFQDKRGNLWFGTNVYNLMRYDGDTLEYLSKKDGVGAGRITGIVEDEAGDVWFATNNVLTHFDGNTFATFGAREGLNPTEIWALMIDRKGTFWLGTNDGVMQFDGQVFTPFPFPKAKVSDTTTNYAYDRITSILEDRKGTFWFGTDGFGITQYDGSSFSHLTKEDGLPGNIIGSLMEDEVGNIWIGTMYGGVSRYDGESFINYTQDGIIDGVEVGGFYQDKNENVWFAAENQGVFRFESGRFDHPCVLNRCGHDLRTAKGLLVHNQELKQSFTLFNAGDGLNTNGILSIFEDQEGRFWLGGWGGLFRFDGESFVSVTRDGPWD